jgi:hypothetical protein
MSTQIPRNIHALYEELVNVQRLQPNAWIQGSGYGEFENGIDLWVARSIQIDMTSRALMYLVDHALAALPNMGNEWALPFALAHAKKTASWYSIDGKARDAVIKSLRNLNSFCKRNKWIFGAVVITNNRKVANTGIRIEGPDFTSMTMFDVADDSILAGLPMTSFAPSTTDNGIPQILSAIGSPIGYKTLMSTIEFRRSKATDLNLGKKELGRRGDGFFYTDTEALWFFRGAMLPVMMVQNGLSVSAIPSIIPATGSELARYNVRVPFQLPARVSPQLQQGVDHAVSNGYEYARNIMVQTGGKLDGLRRSRHRR